MFNVDFGPRAHKRGRDNLGRNENLRWRTHVPYASDLYVVRMRRKKKYNNNNKPIGTKSTGGHRLDTHRLPPFPTGYIMFFERLDTLNYNIHLFIRST